MKPQTTVKPTSYVLQVALAGAMEVEDKAAEDKGADDKGAEDKAVEDKAVEDRAAEDKAVEDKEAEDKAAEDKVAEDKAMEDKAMEDKAAEDKAVEDKAVEDKAVEDKAMEEYDPGELLHAHAHARACIHEYTALAALVRLPRCSPHCPRRSLTSSRDHPLTFQNPTCFSRN